MATAEDVAKEILDSVSDLPKEASESMMASTGFIPDGSDRDKKIEKLIHAIVVMRAIEVIDYKVAQLLINTILLCFEVGKGSNDKLH